MELSIDQQQDYSNKELYTFLSGFPVPEYVKTAELTSVRPEGLEKEAFADDVGKKFPLDTKANVFLSNAFLLHKKAALTKLKGKHYINKVEDRINKAASALGMQVDVAVYNAAVTDKLAADYEDLTISVKLGSDEVDLFSIKTAAHLIDGASNFTKDLEKFPYNWRRPIAEQFVKAAETLGVTDLPETILKYAGLYYPDIVNVKEEILRRATKLGEADRANYEKIAEDISNASSKDEFFDLAEFCYLTEKKAGLYDKPYNKKILGDPVNRFFTLSLDKVASLLDTITMAGERYAVSDLEKVSGDIFEKAFGFEIDPKTADAKDVLPTMPKSDVDLFKKLSGIKPI